MVVGESSSWPLIRGDDGSGFSTRPPPLPRESSKLYHWIDTITAGDGDDPRRRRRGGQHARGGNNSFVVDSTSDVTAENAGQGTDTVLSSGGRTLGANLENLTLTGAAAIRGTDNGFGNDLLGNAGNNTLSGLTGNDTLAGAGGADRLTGITGRDVFDQNALADSTGMASGRDTIIGFDGVGNAAGDRI